MKTSNYILISFLFFLLGLTFLLFLSSKLHPWEHVKKDVFLHEEYLDPYSVVIVGDHSKIQINNDDDASKLVRYTNSEENIEKGKGYIIKSDTLFISQLKYKIKPNLYCSTLKSIVVKEGSDVTMSFTDKDRIEISVLKGNFHGFSQNEKERVGFVKFSAWNNSNVNLTNINIDSLYLNVDGCRMNINRTNIKKLKGSLKNGAELFGYRTLLSKIDLETDMSSKYNLSK